MKIFLIYLAFCTATVFTEIISFDQKLHLAGIAAGDVDFEKKYKLLLDSIRGEIPEDAKLDVVCNFLFIFIFCFAIIMQNIILVISSRN